jgi:hypothetical protein
MTLDAPSSIVARVFEPISLLFPEAGAMPSVPPPVCILCQGPASAPSRMGWVQSPDQQGVFVTCSACSDCDDNELERRIVERITQHEPEKAIVY